MGTYRKIASVLSVWSCRGIATGIVVSALAMSGCSGDNNNSPFVSHEFDLGERSFSIKLPVEASVQASIDKNLVMMHLQSKAQHSPRITLRMPFADDLAVKSGVSKKLGRSGLLSYRVSTANTGNSEVKEAFLNGHLTLGGTRYVVSCSIQSKFVTIEQAAWCVEYLKTLNRR